MVLVLVRVRTFVTSIAAPGDLSTLTATPSTALC